MFLDHESELVAVFGEWVMPTVSSASCLVSSGAHSSSSVSRFRLISASLTWRLFSISSRRSWRVVSSFSNYEGAGQCPWLSRRNSSLLSPSQTSCWAWYCKICFEMSHFLPFPSIMWLEADIKPKKEWGNLEKKATDSESNGTHESRRGLDVIYLKQAFGWRSKFALLWIDR